MIKISSIAKKQIVAVSGLLLVGYLVFHLTMNLLIYFGPNAFNRFPEAAKATGNVLHVAEAGLAAIFLIHIMFTVWVVIENRRARGKGYEVKRATGKRSLATRLMPYTATVLLLFLIIHLRDYTLADHHGYRSVIGAQNLGLFGLVINSFQNPFRMVFYLIAMFSVGFHLAHGIQSVFQSFGVNHPTYTPAIQKISTAIGLFFAVAFSSIPLWGYYAQF